MAEQSNINERLKEFRPSKTVWFWSCAGCVVATIILGFTVGGWVTGGTAQEMAENAAEDARTQLVANVCFENFTHGPEFSQQLAALKEAESWNRSDLIEEGGWVTLAGMEDPLNDAADVCAERLAGMELPAATATPAAATPAAARAEG